MDELDESQPDGATNLYGLTVNQMLCKEIREIKSKINEIIDTLESNGIYR